MGNATLRIQSTTRGDQRSQRELGRRHGGEFQGVQEMLAERQNLSVPGQERLHRLSVRYRAGRWSDTSRSRLRGHR